MSEALIHSQQTLIATQQLTLVQRVAIIEQSADNVEREFYVIGQHLRFIRDTRQYEEGGYFSFEDFCERGIHRTKRRAYQLIQAALAVEKAGTVVPEISTASNERQVRQLIQEQKRDTREAFEHCETMDDVDEAFRVGKPHVAHNSGNNEWYTPADYIEAARSVMGEVNLDPASSPTANEIIRAETFYTADDDGLTRRWTGRIWMNPPYAGELIGKFAAKLCQDFTAGDVKEAIVLVNNATETGWFQDMAAIASAICFPKGRVRFWHPEKESAPLQGQALLYLGGNADRFCAAFESFGFVATL